MPSPVQRRKGRRLKWRIGAVAAVLRASGEMPGLRVNFRRRADRLSFHRHKVPDMPMLGVAARCDAVVLFFVEKLEFPTGKERLDFVFGVERYSVSAEPGIVGTEQVTGKAPAGGNPCFYIVPDAGEIWGSAEGQGKTAVRQSVLRPIRILKGLIDKIEGAGIRKICA